MNLFNLLDERERRYCHFTQYTIIRRQSSIDGCVMDSVSNEMLTLFSILLVNLFAFTAYERISCLDCVRSLSRRVELLNAPAIMLLSSSGSSVCRLLRCWHSTPAVITLQSHTDTLCIHKQQFFFGGYLRTSVGANDVMKQKVPTISCVLGETAITVFPFG